MVTYSAKEIVMTVRVYSGSVLIEERMFKNIKAALKYADWAQDEGFKVRVNES